VGFYDEVPQSLQQIMQNGLLDQVFEQALHPAYLWDTLAEVIPWGGGRGDTSIMTRAGLLPLAPNPITTNDATAQTYGFEQYQMTMNQYGSSIDTNMAESALTLASKFLQDNRNLAIQASGSLNVVAQNALYGAYGEGTTWAADASTTSTALVVEDASGFQMATGTTSTTNSNPTEGLTGASVPILVPVSSSNPINVTIGGTANTVTGVDIATNTLTLGTAISATVGEAVVNVSNGPVQYRPNARASAAQLVSGDVATLTLFTQAATRLRSMGVPMRGGAYTAHIPPATLQELQQDLEFRQMWQSRGDSPVYANFKLGMGGQGQEFLGRTLGIDWILDNNVPTGTNPSGVTYYRPILCGDGCLIKGPFERMGDLVSAENARGTVQIDLINGVARILRAPLDRLGQVLSSTWSWIGGYSVSTDLLAQIAGGGSDPAAFKRAVVVEHA